MKKDLKIAIVHDYIKEYGGAERVLETFHEIFPEATIYTLIYAPQFLGPHKARFRNWKITTSFLQYIPFNYKFISIFRLIAPFVFRTFNFSNYDIVIVSATGAYSPNIINKKKAKQLCYCHTPPRYLYGYATARDMNKNTFIKVGVAIMNHVLRMVDYSSSRNVDQYIANSQTVADRISKFYRKEARIIFPPVKESENGILPENNKRKNYFLAGGRLARPKHIDLLVKACNSLDVSLKIFGKDFAGYGQELRNCAGKSIEFLGEISDEQKLHYMKEAKSFLFAAEDEDFGIVPVEAMSVGTPVIAYKSGGVTETIVENKTGVFFTELRVESVITAMHHFNSLKISPEACQLQAKKFSKEQFITKIKLLIQEIVPNS